MITDSNSERRDDGYAVATDELAARLRRALARGGRRLRQEANSGLTPLLVDALGLVQAYGPLTPSELAGRERLARPGATRIIARLRETGLVDAEADPKDKRSYRVAITPHGESLLLLTRQRSTRFLGRALRSLNEYELALVTEATDLLERIVDFERE